jgi:signal transduction histidine kinase
MDSDTAHYIRNSLNVAQGYLEIFKENQDCEDIRKVESSLEEISEIVEEKAPAPGA